MSVALGFSEKKTQRIVWTLLFVMPVVGMVIDLIAPSLPAISESLHISQKIAKDLISSYLLGYGIGCFGVGLLADSFGRRNLLRAGLVGFVLASLIPVVAPHPGMLLLSRFLQGITMGGANVLMRVIFSDLLSAEKLIRLGTVIGAMWSLGPIVGPVIGGYIQVYLGWKANFCFLAAVSLVSAVSIFYVVPETSIRRIPFRLPTARKNLTEVLHNRQFIASVVLMGLSYSLIIGFNTLGPFLIQSSLHHTPVFFGHLALCLGATFLLTTLFCRRLLNRFSIEILLPKIVCFFWVMSVLALVASYFFPESVVLVMLSSMLMFSACGFIFPLTMGKCLSLFKHNAGVAAATMYLINISISSAVGFFSGFLPTQNATSLMWLYFILLAASGVVCWMGDFRKPAPGPQPRAS